MAAASTSEDAWDMYEKQHPGARVGARSASALMGSRALAAVLGGAGVGLLVAGSRPGIGWALILAGAAAGGGPAGVSQGRHAQRQ